MMNFFDAVAQVNREASIYMPDHVKEWGNMFESLVMKTDKEHPRVYYDRQGRRVYKGDIINGVQTWLPLNE